MLSKVKSNILIKLVKHEIDKLATPMILGLICAFLLQLVYKFVGLYRHIEYQANEFNVIGQTQIEISKMLKDYFDRFYGTNIIFLIIPVCVGVIALYSVYSEFSRKNQTSYTILTLPISRNMILLSKVLVLLIFVLIAHTLMTLSEIGFAFLLSSWMIPEHVEYISRNLIYMIPTLQFEAVKVSLINGVGAIGGGFILAMLTRGTWKIIKICIPIVLMGIFLLGYPVLGAYINFRIFNILMLILPVISLVFSFILFNKKISV